MSRCCLSVGLFLGLLAPSLQTLAAADAPPVSDPGHRQVENLSYRVEDPSDVPLAAPAVRQAMQDRNFAEARKAIDEAAKAKDAPSDYLAYLRAWSLALEKQHDQAIAALEKFEKDFPQSPWLRRARFAKAQAMVAKGDFRGAQAIYEQEAKYLLSDARRQQSAAVYLEFAEARFQPRRADQQPDYKSAGVLYPCPGHGPAGPAMCGSRIPHRLLFAETRHAGRGGQCLREIPRGTRRRPATNGSPLPARRMPAGGRQAAGGAKGLAGTVEDGNGSSPHRPGTTKWSPLPQGARENRSTLRDWPAEAAFHLAETWHCPNPGNDDDLRRGVAALGRFRQSLSHARTGRDRPSANRSESTPPGPRRRGRGHAPALPARPALERLQGTARGPFDVGPDLSWAEEIRGGPRRMARVSRPPYGPRGLERRAAIDHRHRVSRRPGEVQGGRRRGSRQTAGRVHGPLSAGHPQPGHPLCFRADPPSAEEVGSGHRRLAAAGDEVSPQRRGLARPIHDRPHAGKRTQPL